jgi:tRNA A37 N6-isopentenylltransferase MiaA
MHSKKFHTEIVSADSRQIYRELNIGTDIPTKKTRCRKTSFHFDEIIEFINTSI